MIIYDFIRLVVIKPHIKFFRVEQIGVSLALLLNPEESVAHKGFCLGMNIQIVDNVIHLGITIGLPKP